METNYSGTGILETNESVTGILEKTKVGHNTGTELKVVKNTGTEFEMGMNMEMVLGLDRKVWGFKNEDFNYSTHNFYQRGILLIEVALRG